MFSGIVEEVGRVQHVTHTRGGSTLTIGCRTVLEGTVVGDSIAVDGVCLTVTSLTRSSFTTDLQPVTLRRSALRERTPGARVNLERAAKVGQRIGGHYVQGHVDDTGRIRVRRTEGGALVVGLSVPPALEPYVVERGFVAIDGASLTVMKLIGSTMSVSLVRHTQERSTLAQRPVGALVNVEADVVAKYVERQAGRSEPERGLSLKSLARAGYR